MRAVCVEGVGFEFDLFGFVFFVGVFGCIL